MVVREVCACRFPCPSRRGQPWFKIMVLACHPVEVRTVHNEYISAASMQMMYTQTNRLFFIIRETAVYIFTGGAWIRFAGSSRISLWKLWAPLIWQARTMMSYSVSRSSSDWELPAGVDILLWSRSSSDSSPLRKFALKLNRVEQAEAVDYNLCPLWHLKLNVTCNSFIHDFEISFSSPHTICHVSSLVGSSETSLSRNRYKSCLVIPALCLFISPKLQSKFWRLIFLFQPNLPRFDCSFVYRSDSYVGVLTCMQVAHVISNYHQRGTGFLCICNE